MAPPTTYAGVYGASPYMHFSSGSQRGGLRMHFRQRVGVVYLNYDGLGDPFANVVTGDSLNSSYGTHGFCPANPWYFSTPIQTICSLFTNWMMESACYEFVPRIQGGTSNGIALTWGWTTDAAYPEDHGWFEQVGGGGFSPSEAQVAVLPGATQFPAWIPQQCLVVRPREKKWLYSVGADRTTWVGSADDPADLRQQYSGMMCVAGNENSSGTPGSFVILGSLYVTGTIDLNELVSPATVDPSLDRRLIGKAKWDPKIPNSIRKKGIKGPLEEKERTVLSDVRSSSRGRA